MNKSQLETELLHSKNEFDKVYNLLANQNHILEAQDIKMKKDKKQIRQLRKQLKETTMAWEEVKKSMESYLRNNYEKSTSGILRY